MSQTNQLGRVSTMPYPMPEGNGKETRSPKGKQSPNPAELVEELVL